MQLNHSRLPATLHRATACSTKDLICDGAVRSGKTFAMGLSFSRRRTLFEASAAKPSSRPAASAACSGETLCGLLGESGNGGAEELYRALEDAAGQLEEGYGG